MNCNRAMRLNEDDAGTLLEEYSGPRYEVEKQMMVCYLELHV